MIRILLISVFISQFFAQELTDDAPYYELVNKEMSIINNGKISEGSFLYPHLKKSGKNNHINLSKLKSINIEPVMALRWSSTGFEMVGNQTPSSVLWITPGLKISAGTYLFDPHLNIWIYAWGRFNKHSAYGFNGNTVQSSLHLFQYSPNYSVEYYNRTEEPENGIDFDESLGGVALLNPKFDIIWGKFRSHIGPSIRSNIHLSRNTPAYSQFRIHLKPVKKLHMTFMLGQLNSGIPDSLRYEQLYNDNLEIIDKIPTVPRYISMHRIDYFLSEKIRIGLWEQVIFGGRSIPFEYMNPLTLYWSAQHKLGDVDNVQMGFDFEILIKENRFYGAFLMDEWSIFKTLDDENNHNWFGVQIGGSRVLEIAGKKVLINGEYARLDPRIYIHRFEINNPAHHQYNLGYWSGGHSQEIWLSATTFINKGLNFTLYSQLTKKGMQDVAMTYGDDSIDWMSGIIKKRNVFGIEGNYISKNNLRYNLKMQLLDTQNLYDDDSIIDVTFAIFYNLYQ